MKMNYVTQDDDIVTIKPVIKRIIYPSRSENTTQRRHLWTVLCYPVGGALYVTRDTSQSQWSLMTQGCLAFIVSQSLNVVEVKGGRECRHYKKLPRTSDPQYTIWTIHYFSDIYFVFYILLDLMCYFSFVSFFFICFGNINLYFPCQ